MKQILTSLLLFSWFACAHDHDPSEYASSLKNQKAVLVTGASSGLGKAIAEKLAAEGYFVYAGARKQKDLRALSAQKNMLGIRMDVTKPKEISEAVKTIKAQGRGLYGLVNNAGVTVMEPLIEVSEESMRFQMDVNVFGPYRVTKAFAPLIIESQGRIVTTSSLLGVTAGGFTGPYSMSKHAMEAFTDALAAELKKFNVQVSVIEPGNFNSNVIKSMRERMRAQGINLEDSIYAEELKRLQEYFPEDRSKFKSPEAVADAALHALFAENPKRRYLVAPEQREAELAIKGILRRMVQLNTDQPFSYSRDELIAMLDALLQGPHNGKK